MVDTADKVSNPGNYVFLYTALHIQPSPYYDVYNFYSSMTADVCAIDSDTA